MADGNMDIAGAMEMLNQMLSEGDGAQQLQDMIGRLSSKTEETPATENAGIDMDMMMKLGQAMTIMNQKKEDDHTRLLLALRPFLKPKRQEKVDHAMRLLKLGDILHIIHKVQEE